MPNVIKILEELAQGGAARVEEIRSEPDERFEAVIRSQQR
jgi:hypothetical protein